MTKSPTWSGESMAATTPVLLTTKVEILFYVRFCIMMALDQRVTTRSVTDSRVSSVRQSLAKYLFAWSGRSTIAAHTDRAYNHVAFRSPC